MSERILVYDLDGRQVNDTEGAIDYASGLNWNTAWPKGYMEMSFRCRRRDIFADWVVKESYGVIVYDGGTIVYQGRIETINPDRTGAIDTVTVHCVGWWVVFEERQIYKWWIDVNALSHLKWPPGVTTDTQQTEFITEKREGTILKVLAAAGDHTRGKGERYRELYELPSGTVRKLSFSYLIRSSEGVILAIKNGDNFPVAPTIPRDSWEWEWLSKKEPYASSATVTIGLGATRTFEIWVYLNKGDIFDQSDYAHISNLKVWANYESGHRTSTPTWTQGQLVEDVVLLVNQQGEQISEDFSQLSDPGLVLDPFMMDKRAYAGSVIEKIASYGDSNLQTWGPAVWDQTGTADEKPRFTFTYRSTDNWEYEVWATQEELSALNYERVSDNLHNDVAIIYTNSRGETIVRTAADNADYADNISISKEYRRGFTIDLGDGDATRADYVARRFMEYHSTRVTRGSISLKGRVRLKGGGYIPANRVRAGKRFKLLNTGEVFFIRYTSYDAESKTVRISPDLPEDNMAMLFAQRDRKLGQLV